MIWHIFLTTIMPILLMVMLGYGMDRKFHMDLDTLSKLNFYIVAPAFLFLNMYKYHFNAESSQIIWLTIVSFIALWLGSLIMERALGFIPSMRGIFRNALLFNNCGNIGVPLIVFIYSNEPFLEQGNAIWLEAAIAIQIVVFIFQSMVTNSLGFYFAGAGKMSHRDAVMLVLKMPIIYAVLGAVVFNAANIPLEGTFFWPVLTNISNSLVLVALFTLGVQLARTPFNFFNGPVMWATVGRLLLGPLLTWACIIVYELLIEPVSPLVTQVLIISAAVPSGVTTALIAAALKSHSDYATQIVVATTVFSAITLPLVIMGVKLLG
ncbi:MAG: AEC family transporter [Veillonella sp.]|uniref:AEC family transporter n=1 Tax=Veillonella sp. TaxID=1926307 RepID=UPI0025EB5ECC|nr:AEC family transporter [Veillonella sp.]MBS4913045.1 AEC family transporter [Veillonella sp.]